MTAPLSPEEFTALTGVSPETLAKLRAYEALLRQWSERINLVSRDSLGDLWRRHFLDSAQLFPLLPAGARRLVDLGSGAGFPGLVLAIMGAFEVELVEADARKCAFLREASRLVARPVTISQTRIDSLERRVADVVTARALAPLDRLLPLAERFIGPETRCLFPKGKAAGQELAAARKTWVMDATSQPSLSDPSGVILCLARVKRREAVRPS